jgi:hypothetical protein
MSRILRRPMFRGGPVDSRGTGITSGLDDGYMDGGRVEFQRGGFSTIPGIDDLSQVGIYNPFTGFSAQNITPFQRRQQDIATANRRGIFSPTIEQIQRNEMRDILGNITPEQRREMDIRTQAQAEQEDISTSKFALANPPLLKTKLETGTETGTGKGDIDLDEEIFDEEKIKRESKLYEKLLGGEEARSQSIYDALLAAAPGFFKGRNLREAAPQVLESINKSGAFDKPRDIRQAAAQLAIQRRIAVETARAKSDDQLTRLEKQLSAKEPKGISELFATNKKLFDNTQEAAMNAAVRTFGADKVASGNSILNKKTKLPDRNLMEPGIIYVINNRYYFLDEKGNPRENYM